MARLNAWVTQRAAVSGDEAGGWPNLKQRNTNWIIIIQGCRAILERDYSSPGALATRPAERGSSASPHNLKGPAVVAGESPYLDVKAFLLESKVDEGTRQILGIYVWPVHSCWSKSLSWLAEGQRRNCGGFSVNKTQQKQANRQQKGEIFLSGTVFFLPLSSNMATHYLTHQDTSPGWTNLCILTSIHKEPQTKIMIFFFSMLFFSKTGKAFPFDLPDLLLHIFPLQNF